MSDLAPLAAHKKKEKVPPVVTSKALGVGYVYDGDSPGRCLERIAYLSFVISNGTASQPPTCAVGVRGL